MMITPMQKVFCKIDKRNFTLEQQYADDISFISNNKEDIHIKLTEIPHRLAEFNLKINVNKTEQHTISYK